MRFLFGEWMPDQPAHLSKALTVAQNVYPAANGYRPVKSFAATHTALADVCKGAAAFITPGGAGTIIAGTATTLYKVNAGAWQQLTTDYSIQGDGRWRFAQFGALAIATNGADAMIKVDLNSFVPAVLLGSPPKCKLLSVVKDFLVAGQVDGNVLKLQWSGINNAEFWTPAQRQSDFQIMPTGGEINGIIGGEFGLILQRNRICRMDYVGGNVIFDFNEISTNIGCVSIHSVVQSGQLAFWRSDNGFIMWDGASLKPIGNEKIDRYFDTLYTSADWADASTAVDVKNNLVCWSMGDRIFVYNWALGRWSVIVQAAEIIFGGVVPGISLDEVDDFYSANLDTLPVSLDDASLKGGDPSLFAFSSSHAMGRFTGGNMAATLKGENFSTDDEREIRANRFRALSDAVAGVTLTITSREMLGSSGTDTSQATMETNGDLPMRVSGRYLQMALLHSSGSTWSFTQGVNAIQPKAGGRR